MEERNSQEIEAYLDGSLEGKARSAFEERLKEDRRLAAQVDLHREVEERLEAHHKAQLTAEWRRHLQENQGTQRGRIVQMPMRVVGNAASVLVLLGVAWWLLQPVAPEVLADRYWAETANFSYADMDRSTTPSDADQALLQQAYQFYEQENFAGTLERLEGLSVKPESARLLEGAAHFQLDNLETAERIFRSILDDPQAVAKDEARWYLALNYVKQGDQAAAKAELEAIVATGGWKVKEAQQLLKRL
ncbi:MAG: hypothetical protein KDC44_10805 [Phaeodactylibacter sp.]|nr:hypothetical protein [Phaeodactylibacter sp.]